LLTVLVLNRLQPLVLRSEATLWARSGRIPIVNPKDEVGRNLGIASNKKCSEQESSERLNLACDVYKERNLSTRNVPELYRAALFRLHFHFSQAHTGGHQEKWQESAAGT